ncbi:MAG: hypothetical protein ACK4WH_14940 [Phycisphaerales bacterium]
MSIASVSVPEFFEHAWQSYEQEVASHSLQKAECEKTGRSHVDSLRRLQGDLDNKEALRKQAAENGLDTSPLSDAIERLRGEIESLQERLAELARFAAQSVPKPPYDKELVSRFVRHLTDIGVRDAVVLSSLDGAASHLAVVPSDLRLGDNGKVTRASVRFANRIIGEVTVSPQHSRFAKHFRPTELDWVPELNAMRLGEGYDRSPEVHCPLFLLEDKHLLLLPSEYSFQYQTWPGGNQTARITEDVGPFILASGILAGSVTQAGGDIRLDENYHDRFLSRICELIQSLTLEQPRWPLNTEWPNSEKVLPSISEELSLVASAPWSDALDGAWAKTKYTLENGERPRVWRKVHADHYGIRLRTRDHTWLVGEIFIDRSQQPGKPGDPIEKAGAGRELNYQGQTRRIGRMYMRMQESRDDR